MEKIYGTDTGKAFQPVFAGTDDCNFIFLPCFDDDFDDDDYYDDDFDDDYDDEGISDDTRSVDEFDDYFDDDDFDSFDDYNIKKEKRKKGDTFEMDFIDLD